MKILPKQKPNNFEIGIAYQSMNRVKFLEFLLSIREFARMKNLVSLIKQMIAEIRNSNKYAFWSHAKAILPHKGGVARDAYDYTKTDKYASSEQVLFKMIGYDKAYNDPEITSEYVKVRDILTKKTQTQIKALEKKVTSFSKDDPDYDRKVASLKKQIRKTKEKEADILRNISLSGAFLNGLTKNIEFVYNGKSMVLIDKDMFSSYQEFTKQYAQVNGKLNDRVLYFGGEYALVESGTELFIAFEEHEVLRKEPEHEKKSPDKEKNTKQEKETEKSRDAKPDKERDAEKKKPNRKSAKDETKQKDDGFQKVANKTQEKMIQNEIATKVSIDPELANGSSCRIKVLNKIVRATDQNFIYIQIPDSKMHGLPFKKDGVDLKDSVLRIPSTYATEVKNGYFVELPMREEFKILSKDGKDRLSDGQAVFVKGSEIVRAFSIAEVKLERKPLDLNDGDLVIDGVPHKVDAGNGFIFARTDTEAKILSGPQEGEVLIPESVELDGEVYPITSIETNAFANTKITSVKIPESVKHIGSSAFVNCRELSEVSLGEGVESIGSSAFRDCSKLEKLTVPKTTKEIGINPMEGCDSLQMEVDKENGSFQMKDGMLIKDGRELVSFLPGQAKPQIEIPEGIEKVGASSFKDVRNVKEVVLPETCKVIEPQAFERCGIETLRSKSPDSLTVSSRAFESSCLKEMNVASLQIEGDREAFKGTSFLSGAAKPNSSFFKSREMEERLSKQEKQKCKQQNRSIDTHFGFDR